LTTLLFLISFFIVETIILDFLCAVTLVNLQQSNFFVKNSIKSQKRNLQELNSQQLRKGALPKPLDREQS
jgi:hypothetical protein